MEENVNDEKVITEKENKKEPNKFQKSLILGLVFSILIPILTAVFYIGSSNVEAEDMTDLSLYSVSSNVVSLFSSGMAPGEDMPKGIFSSEENLYTAGQAGGVLGFAEALDDAEGVSGWLTSQLSSSSVTFSYRQLEQLEKDTPSVTGLSDYADYGSTLQNELGLTTTRSSGTHLMSMSVGALFLVAYWFATIASSLFGLTLSLLSYFNPFRLFTALTSGVEELSIPILSGGAEVISDIYEAVQQMTLLFLIPLMLAFVIFSILVSKAPFGKKILRLYVRVFFVFAGLPIIGATYTGIVDSLSEELDGSSLYADYIVASTFVDVENWVYHSRLAPTEENKIQKGDTYVPRAMAIEINGTRTGVNEFKNIYTQYGPHNDFSDIIGDEAEVQINDATGNVIAVKTGDKVPGLILRYMGGDRITSSDYEGYVASNVVKDVGDENEARGMYEHYYSEVNMKKYIDNIGSELSFAPDDDLFTWEAGTLYSGGSLVSDGKATYPTFSSDYTADYALTNTPVPVAGADSHYGGLSSLAMYNFLNTRFEGSSMTVYSPSKASSALVLEAPTSVSMTNVGWFGFLQPLESIVLLLSTAIVSVVYAYGMASVAYASVPRIATSIFGTAMGSIAFITKLLVSVVVLIIEIIGTVLLYMLTESIMMGFLSNADELVATVTSGFMGLAAQSLKSLAIMFIAIILAFISIKNRKTFTRLMEDTVTSIIEKLMGVLDSNVNQGNPFGSSIGNKNDHDKRAADHAANGGGVTEGFDGMENGIKGLSQAAVNAGLAGYQDVNARELEEKNEAGMKAKEKASTDAYEDAYPGYYQEGLEEAKENGLDGDAADEFASKYAHDAALGDAEVAGALAQEQAEDEAGYTTAEKLAQVGGTDGKLANRFVANRADALSGKMGPAAALAATMLGASHLDGNAEERLNTKEEAVRQQARMGANLGDKVIGGVDQEVKDRMQAEARAKYGQSDGTDVPDSINPINAQDQVSFDEEMETAHYDPAMTDSDYRILDADSIEPDQEDFGSIDDNLDSVKNDLEKAESLKSSASESSVKSQEAKERANALRAEAKQARQNGNLTKAKGLEKSALRADEEAEAFDMTAQQALVLAERHEGKADVMTQQANRGDKILSDATKAAGGTGSESFADPDDHPDLDFTSEGAFTYTNRLHDAAQQYTQASKEHAVKAKSLDDAASVKEENAKEIGALLDETSPDYEAQKTRMDNLTKSAANDRKKAQAHRDQGQTSVRKAKAVQAKAQSAQNKVGEAIALSGVESIQEASQGYKQAQTNLADADQKVKSEVGKLRRMVNRGASEAQIATQTDKVEQAEKGQQMAQGAMNKQATRLTNVLPNTNAVKEAVQSSGASTSEQQSATSKAMQAMEAVQSTVVKNKDGSVNFEKTQQARQSEVKKQGQTYNNRIKAMDEKINAAPNSTKEEIAKKAKLIDQRESLKREQKVYGAKMNAGMSQQASTQKPMADKYTASSQANQSKGTWSRQSDRQKAAIESYVKPKVFTSQSERYVKDLSDSSKTEIPVQRQQMAERNIRTPEQYKEAFTNLNTKQEKARADYARTNAAMHKAAKSGNHAEARRLQQEVKNKRLAYNTVKQDVKAEKSSLMSKAGSIYTDGFGKENPLIEKITSRGSIRGDINGMDNNMQVYAKNKKRVDFLENLQRRGKASKAQLKELSYKKAPLEKMRKDLTDFGIAPDVLNDSQRAHDAANILHAEWGKAKRAEQ